MSDIIEDISHKMRDVPVKLYNLKASQVVVQQGNLTADFLKKCLGKHAVVAELPMDPEDILGTKRVWCVQCKTQMTTPQSIACALCKMFRPLETYPNLLAKPM